MIADITKTGGLVLLKNRTGSIFILDSIKFMKKIRYTKEGNKKIYTKNKIFLEKKNAYIFPNCSTLVFEIKAGLLKFFNEAR